MARGVHRPCPTCGRPYVPPDLGPALRAQYEAGATLAEVAESAEISIQTARLVLRVAGTEMRRPGRRNPADERAAWLAKERQT
jgi:hypothetical protein